MKNVIKPTLLLDKKKVITNIERMVYNAGRNNVVLRPHFKTHQSKEIGRWFKEFGINKITVSSVDMAKYFAEDGWTDITIAFPFNILEINKLNKINKKTKFNLLVESPEVISFLSKELKREAGIFIKVDSGAHRTGLEPDNYEFLADLIDMTDVSKRLKFAGFLTHAGHTYSARGIDEIKKIHNQQLAVMQGIKKNLGCSRAFVYSIGDTPSCSTMTNFEGITEIRPGNFVLYDAMQIAIGSCNANQVAAVVACPVVAKHPERNEIVVYGGAIHFSKEAVKLSTMEIYGLPVKISSDGWNLPLNGSYVRALSQEHGIIKMSDEEFRKIKIGDIIGVIPAHSCLTVNLMRNYYTLEGEKIKTMN